MALAASEAGSAPRDRRRVTEHPGAPQGGAGSDFFVRALAVVAAAGVAHFALAHALLVLMVEGGPFGVPHGRELVSLAVVAALLAQLGALWLRSQHGDPADVVRAVPTALRRVAPAAMVLLALLMLPPSLLEDEPLRLCLSLAPAAAAVWSAAVLVAIPTTRVLHALAIRAPGGRAPRAGAAPPPLVEHEVRGILAAAALAMSLLVLGAIAHRLASAPGLDVAMLLPALGVLAFPLLAAVAGHRVGQAPGQELLSVARRLDEPTDLEQGAQAEAERGSARPIVVTRHDEVGELLSNLEALRGRLDHDLRRYESVLEEAQAAERTKADFLHAVSHELRTPLNVVGGWSQLLLEGRPMPLTDAQAEDVRLIRAGGKQLLELVNDILDLSMIESGDLRLMFSRADLGTLVRDTVELMRPQVRDRPVGLWAEVSPGLPPVVCDRRRIGQILTNLVSNAIKFTEEGDIVVRVAYDAHADAVTVRCIDTGVGIDPTELDAIFEEYRQAGTPSRRKKGTGLGLAIARSIAEHHGGHLRAESVVGQGSTFTLELPLDPPGRPAFIDVTEEAARAVVRRTLRPGELRAVDLR
jgi:signal transduction histidine kinase